MPDKTPAQTIDDVVKYLERRAAFWDQFPEHKNTAKALRNEAFAIQIGKHLAKHDASNA